MQRLESITLDLRHRSAIAFLLPLCLLAIMGSSITFLHGIFNNNTRWLIFFTLSIYLLAKNHLLRYLDAKFALALFLYISWCFLSSFWSNIPALSFSKSGLLICMVFTMLCAGMEWVRSHTLEDALSYLWIVACVSLLAGYLGHYSLNIHAVYDISSDISMYRGLTGNSNMFGILLVMSLPYLLFKLYCGWQKKVRRFFYFALTLSCFYYLSMTFSRASIMAGMATLFGFLFSLRLGKKLMAFLMLATLCVTTVLINPTLLGNTITTVSNKYIYKTNRTSLLSSRLANFSQSYEGAVHGGLTGVGYGVSWGFNEFDFKEGLSSIFYGREKGNSLLAIVEETGIIGLVFYMFVILLIMSKLFKMYFTVKDEQSKVLVGILFGIFFGMLAQSMLEAWWDAPGSPEGNYFWLLIGTIRGVEIVLRHRRQDEFTMET